MSARNAILDRLRRAERTGLVPTPDRRTLEPVRAAIADDERLARFVKELEALGAGAFVETTDADVRARVAAIVGSRSVLRWDASHLPYAIGEMFTSAATGASPRSEQATAEVGLTGADGGIAETGSLVVLSGEGRPRAASLLPPTHLAIVRRSDIYASMGDYFAERGDAIANAACCTFITGPSRTADIELTLTLGVHGPGVVKVVVGP